MNIVKEWLEGELAFGRKMLKKSEKKLQDAIEYREYVRRKYDDAGIYDSACESVEYWEKLCEQDAARVAETLKELEAVA